MRLAAAIIDVARQLARSVPAPRDAPYFCLDTETRYDLRILDAFSARGIFRKYEFALDLGSGLGGRARWLAARTGCRVVGIDPRPSVVAAARLLNRRVRMDDQVIFQVGAPSSVPLRARLFTHVWLVDPPADANVAAMCCEAFRALRGGAHFALQSRPPSVADRGKLPRLLSDAGFVDIDVVDTQVTELPDACRLAAEQLRGALRDGLAPLGLPTDRAPAEQARVQIFARRPA